MADDDDWETSPEPANLISEKEQRWGAATLPQDADESAKSIADIRKKAADQHAQHAAPNHTFSHGYGGKFGVQEDRAGPKEAISGMREQKRVDAPADQQ
eukprot:TRINITY_DN4462_c0_g1::TRINITY_DN4462_c0_g1_i1::g.7247::m.7247 TRINITY_DN4462_c0_g1::TRINITY_DN4462_c0_g1_i1::g.7247  ORF type:complete len:113 (-),score=26.51,sp/Q01406/SRC8_CHICK/42.67/6e-11,HS1_rep/PF02218.10/0.00047 TRINITY_DN4462_c0_g1_i1:14-310(-)